MPRTYKRDSKGRFSSGGGGGGGKKTAASKPPATARAAGGRQAQAYRKERGLAARDERRGISPFARSVASSERMQKRGIAKKRQKAGQEAVPTAKGLAVKTKGPLAGVRKAAFKAVAKLQRSRRAADVTAPGQKLPRWAGKPSKKR